MFRRLDRLIRPFLFLLFCVCCAADGQGLGKVVPHAPQGRTTQINVRPCDLVVNPELYNGKEVTLQGKYAYGFEWSIIFPEGCPQRLIWVESRELNKTLVEALKGAFGAGFVYLTVQGTFLSGGRYGHLGGFSSQILAHKIISVLRISSESHVLTDSEGLDWQTYGSSLNASLDKNWLANIPASVHNGLAGQNSVEFRVSRDGSVADDSIKLASASNSSDLDEASLKAVHAAGPFGDLPSNFSRGFITLCSVFSYNVRPEPAREENPYFEALVASTLEMEKAYAARDDSLDGARVRTDYHHMLVVVELDSGIRNDLPRDGGDHQFEYLDSQQLVARAKRLRKKFSVLRVQTETRQVPKITVSLCWVSYEKKRLSFEVSDWSEVALLYDCEKRAYVVSRVRLGSV